MGKPREKKFCKRDDCEYVTSNGNLQRHMRAHDGDRRLPDQHKTNGPPDFPGPAEQAPQPLFPTTGEHAQQPRPLGASSVQPEQGLTGHPAQPQQQVQKLERVSDVLAWCGIDESHEFDGISRHLMDELTNFRLDQPRIRQHHTPWHIEQYAEISSHGETPLPDAGAFAIDLMCSRKTSTLQGEGWRGADKVPLAPEDWSTCINRMTANIPHDTRIFNVRIPPQQAGMSGFRACAERLALEMCPPPTRDDLVFHAATANFGPKLTVTHAHYDSVPDLATGLHWEGVDSERPLKLWLIWPTTEALRFGGSYAKTNKALTELENGRFLVQMPGDVIFVPANAPHAVISLNSCILVGHTFQFGKAQGPWDPSTVQLALASGIKMKTACDQTLQLLASGLQHEKFRKVYVAHFALTWSSDLFFVRTRKDYLKRVTQIWVDDLVQRHACALCAHLGWESVQDFGDRDARDHLLRYHLQR